MEIIGTAVRINTAVSRDFTEKTGRRVHDIKKAGSVKGAMLKTAALEGGNFSAHWVGQDLCEHRKP